MVNEARCGSPCSSTNLPYHMHSGPDTDYQFLCAVIAGSVPYLCSERQVCERSQCTAHPLHGQLCGGDVWAGHACLLRASLHRWGHNTVILHNQGVRKHIWLTCMVSIHHILYIRLGYSAILPYIAGYTACYMYCGLAMATFFEQAFISGYNVLEIESLS